METKKYIKVQDLEVYRLARELSRVAWGIYEELDWRDKKTIGDQFITSSDSVGANVAEGYARYHYLDKIRFFYNARGSLVEAVHWTELLKERGKIKESEYVKFQEIAERESLKLQNFISVNYKSKKQ